MSYWYRKNDLDEIVEIVEEDPTGKFHESIVWYKSDKDISLTEDNGVTPENNQSMKDEIARTEELAKPFIPLEDPIAEG